MKYIKEVIITGILLLFLPRTLALGNDSNASSLNMISL